MGWHCRAMSSMGQMWHAAFMLLSGQFLAGGDPAPGCSCQLTDCCPEMLSEDLGQLSWLLDGPSKSLQQQKTAAPPPACELLAFSKDPNATCSKQGTICNATVDDIVEHFPNDGILLRTALGRFFGHGTCQELSSRTCAAAKMVPYSSRIDQWRRVLMKWDDTNETIDFSNFSLGGLGSTQMQLEETCDSGFVLNIKASWLPHGQLATNISIPEGEWKYAADNSALQWTCVDLDGPDGIPQYHALYLKMGGYPCKSVPGLEVGGVLSKLKHGFIILLLIGLVCCLCCFIALVVFCCSFNKDDELSESESDEDFS